MKNVIQKALTKSALKILTPLIRTLLRNGVSCGSFEEIARTVYVEEAFNLIQESQGKATVSAVSAKTGLSRKEVKRLHETETVNYSENDEKYNRATKVIRGWTNDKDFTSLDGKPKTLPTNSENISFATLVKKYSGDVTPKAMMDMLLSAQCIRTDRDKVTLIKPAYVPGTDSTELINILGNDAFELMSTINHNIESKSAEKRYQRKVSSKQINPEHLNEFKTLAATKSQALLEDLDAWLSKHEASGNANNHYVSLGIYFYQNQLEEGNHETLTKT